MASRKRAYGDVLDEGSSISILPADGGRLTADKYLLIVASSCARGLPSDAAEWDLSQLQVEGQPVSRDVVIAWLHAVCWAVVGEPYPAEPQADPPLGSTAAGLAQLLAFADAVGSNTRVLEACLQLSSEVYIVAQAGEQRLKLHANVGHYWDLVSPLQLNTVQPNSKGQQVAILPSEEVKAQVTQQFAQQVEVLLFLAHKLQLRDFIDKMHSCVQRNSIFDTSLTSTRVKAKFAAVMSARVLEAAAGPGEDTQQDFINRVLTHCGTLCPVTGLSAEIRRLLKPVHLTSAQQRPLQFTAELLEDLFAPGSKGQQLQVSIDLFGASTLTVGDIRLPMQLQVGQRDIGRLRDPA